MFIHSRAVFSYAMRIRDEIRGWEDEEKGVGSKFAACMWVYIKEVLTRGQKPTPEMEECLKRRLMSIKLCMKWVCAGTFDDQKWVSESTITQHEEEMMGMELDYELRFSVCGTILHGVVSAPTRLNRSLEDNGKNSKSTTKL